MSDPFINHVIGYVTIRELSKLSGYTEGAIRRKIERGIFVEGKHYKRAPDGRIHIHLENYKKWLLKEPIPESNRAAKKSESRSIIEEPAGVNHLF